jgi:hypothetical protein
MNYALPSSKSDRHAIKTLGSRLCKTWGNLERSDRIWLEELQKIVDWEESPKFERMGRSAYLPLPEPIAIPNSRVSIRAIKIKGVGARTHTQQVLQPTNESICNNNPHLGFDEAGRFTPTKTAPAPLGGITLDRAQQEFDVSAYLFEHHVPSIVPLQVYEYTDRDMTFLSSDPPSMAQLGVVITGLPDRSYLRADSVFHYHHLSKLEQMELDDWMERLNISGAKNRPLALITTLSRLYGKTIRKFSESGLYRYSGAPDNYSYCTQTGEVFLIDLDSSLHLNQVSPQRQSLEIMRDAASGIAYLLAFLTDPRIIKDFPEQQVRDSNPFRALLQGYYHNVNSGEIDRLSEIIVEYYSSVYKKAEHSKDWQSQGLLEPDRLSATHREQPIQEFCSYLSRSYMRPWISRSDTFAWLMPICWWLHQASGVSSTPVLDEETLFKNIAEYEKRTRKEPVDVMQPTIAETVRQRLAL